MPQTSRELVQRCLKFESPERVPRDLWLLPWVTQNYPHAVERLQSRFPIDFAKPDDVYRKSELVKGDPFMIGEYIDEWGCVFTNIQDGCIGEVRNPILTDLSEWQQIQPPYDTLPHDYQQARDAVNRFCEETDLFVLSICCPRPWERYQFLRGSENAMMDLMEPERGFLGLLHEIHDFYLKELEFWISTDVDGITFMDDWGAQSNLLISPGAWREHFKPLYKEYCDIAHSVDKFTFMHSDGHISAIFEDLIEIGVDAINSQLFCMDMNELADNAKGKITFWGEIDRQSILPSSDPKAGRDAVQTVASHLYQPEGGVIAQFEFGLGANPDTAYAIFEEWENIRG